MLGGIVPAVSLRRKLGQRHFRQTIDFIGAGSPNRTGDRLITNQVLYLLSYTGMVPF